jgi:hypothetical protein
MPEAGSQRESAGAFSDAADRIRDSAKWLLTAFAGVGAVLAAGLPLADLGKLASDRNDHRLQLAIAAIVAAELGIGIAIGAAASVINRSFVTLKWLKEKKRRRKNLDGDSILLAGHDDVPQLYDKMTSALQAHREAVEKWVTDPNETNSNAMKQRNDVVYYYDQIVMKVVQQASYRRLSRAYVWARVIMLFGAAVAAGGITLFAWAVRPPG